MTDYCVTLPAWDSAAWARTKRSFHLYAQMLGKIRVALSPSQPNWMFTALALSARGITTGPMPWRGGSLAVSIDVFSSEIILEQTDGKSRHIPLVPARTIAHIYADLHGALEDLEVECVISPVPQEVEDVTPFPEDTRPAPYDAETVRRWFSATTSVAGLFDIWRAHFFGRTGIQVWWGALDVALLLFNDKHVAPPSDRGYLMKYDLDAEMMNAGLFFGDDKVAPFFYGYIFPQPPGAEHLPVASAGATWSEALKEWVLPYETVRTAADPAAELRSFLDSIYSLCASAAGWDTAALSYAAPKRVQSAPR